MTSPSPLVPRPVPSPARRRRRPVLLAVALVAGVGLAPAAPSAGAMPTPAAGAPALWAQAAPDDDVPLPGNPPSPRIAEVEARSAELSARAADRRDAEGDLTAAERRRDDLRAALVDLAEARVEAVDRLARRRVEEARRVDEREAAADLHRRRTVAARAAEDEVADAEAVLRESVVAAYMASGGAPIGGLGPLVVGVDPNEDLLKAGVEEASTEAREADLAARGRDRDRAVAARERARRTLDAARDAEDAAIDAREATEAEIVAIDDDEVRTRGEEAASVTAVARRGEDLLIALAAEVPARLRAQVVGVDFPVVALDAWVKASDGAPCPTPWWALAGISRIESRHGTYRGGRLDARGYPTVAIIGPRLDGSGGFAAILDTDGGILDGDPIYDRAVGPMQFIPSTWARWGRDGDGDGRRDPHSIYDAAAAAAAYLCHGRRDLGDEAQLRAAYFSYNHSQAYVSAVLAEAHRYRDALALPA